MILKKPDVETIREIIKEFECGCETCAHSAAICPATASSYVQEIACLRRDYDLLAQRANKLERMIGNIAMMLREDMTSGAEK
jgi:hypothetical protein